MAPRTPKPVEKTVHTGEILIRARKSDSPYPTLAFNTRLASASDEKDGGRFDCVEGTPIPDRFSVYYVAETLEVAFWETQQYLRPKDPRIAFKSSLANREFVYLMVRKTLKLADVRHMRGAGRFGLVPKDLDTDNRLVTRGHAVTIRHSIRDLHGLYYHSAAEGSAAIVLMQPSCGSDHLEVFGDAVPMDVGLGLTICRRILADAGISLRMR